MKISPTTAHTPAPFMYTQCPACKTVFRLHPDQLNAAQGQVRCSRCHTVFNALNNLFQQATPDVVKKQPATPFKKANALKGKSDTPPSIESPESPAPERTGSHSPRKHMAKSRGDHKAPSQPDRTEKKQAAARERDKALDDGVLSLFNEEPTVVEMLPEMLVAPSTASTAIEETLPLFKPDHARADPAIKATSKSKPLLKKQPESAAKKTAEPPSPLFEFNTAIDELPIAADADADNHPTGKSLAGKKKSRPTPPQNEELDLVTLSESQPSEEDNSLLFHYLPEENLTAELLPGNLSTDGRDGAPESNTQGKRDTHKATKTRPGYTLPLEHEITRSSLRGTMIWGIGITLMLAALALQYLYYHRMALAQEPRLRPLLAQMCHISGCQLPAQRDLTRIELGKHLVQIHPRYVDSLLITATLVNSADFAQPFPVVEVVMTDLEQKQVARRRFLPRDYLIGDDGEGLLAPATEVPLMLEVLDPGKNAVGFEFNFY